MKNKSKTKPNNIQYQLIYIYLIIETKSKNFMKLKPKIY